jgi:hypothetical protein
VARKTSGRAHLAGRAFTRNFGFVCYNRWLVRRLFVVPVVLAAGLLALALPDLARADGVCGLPRVKTLWIEHGNPDVEKVFGRPGVVVAVSSGDFPARMRAAGARTVYWDMHLNKRVGTPSAPADPAEMVEKANRLFDGAARQSACPTPRIALNELFGSHLETPWSVTNTQYRDNVLTFVRQLHARGARPFLLLSTTPYTASEEAANWWREVAKYSDIVPEVYFPAPSLHAQGPVLANRRMRLRMRRAVDSLTAIGIPPSKIGIVLGFQSRPGGREGLKPAHAWFRVVKWQALAGRQMATELGISSVWSWGWATYSGAKDPDKPAAACVYLWTRNPALCDGPAAAGPQFDRSLTEGQIRLPASQTCSFGRRGIGSGELAALQRTTGDRHVAATILLARLSEAPWEPVTAREILQAERAVVALRFGGSQAAYRAALARANATLAIARGALGDEIRRARIEARLPGRRPSPAEVTTFYLSYPDLLVRSVRANPAPWWLDRRVSGLALRSLAPERVFSLPEGRRATVFALDRPYAVTPLGQSQRLGATPFAQARPTIAAALTSFARRASFENWTTIRQNGMERQAICRKDEVPEPGTVRLTAYLPFLSLTGP